MIFEAPLPEVLKNFRKLRKTLHFNLDNGIVINNESINLIEFL